MSKQKVHHHNHVFGKIASILLFLVIFALVLGLGYTYNMVQKIQTQQATDVQTVTNVSYVCDGQKTISSLFFNNNAEVTLSDGRTLLLIQGISGSGVRYTNWDESITFWTKGNTAFVEEGPTNALTYNNCVETLTN